MANQYHLEKIFQGYTHWNEWRWEHPEMCPDLSNAFLLGVNVRGTVLSDTHGGAFLPGVDFSAADLTGIRLGYASLEGANFHHANVQEADLSNVNLSYADLRNATLSHALLYSANLTNAQLSGADLSNASLNKANLSGADLTDADLSGADLSGAVFNATTLTNARLHEATLGWTLFVNVDLSSVQGLETIKHEGPSSVGFDTLLRSRGMLPHSFLFQTGMDQAMIEVVQQQEKQSRHALACSLGHTLADQPFAQHLQASIQATGAPCWLVARDIPPGTPRPTFASAFFERYNRLVLVLSQAALASEEIQEEVETALKMEAQRQQQVLFPVYLDEAVLTTSIKWVIQLRENRSFLDGTGWQEEARYQQVFQRLVQMLQQS